MIGTIRVPPLVVPEAEEPIPLNWWALDLPSPPSDGRSPWTARPSPLKDAIRGANTPSRAPGSAGKQPSGPTAALSADKCSPFTDRDGRRHMLPRSSLPPASAGRFEFAALKNALADDDDDDADLIDDVAAMPMKRGGGASGACMGPPWGRFLACLLLVWKCVCVSVQLRQYLPSDVVLQGYCAVTVRAVVWVCCIQTTCRVMMTARKTTAKQVRTTTSTTTTTTSWMPLVTTTTTTRRTPTRCSRVDRTPPQAVLWRRFL